MNLISNAIDALEEKMKSDLLDVTTNQSETVTNFSPTITINTGIVGRDSSTSRLTPHALLEPTIGECLPKKDSDVEASYIFIRIADNGSGMTQKTQQQLFEPFFTTKPVGKGTGLGLAISYQIIVEKHGGKLWCHSAPGQGAEFVVEIPIYHR
jgi:signal transduction histidine kinase